MKNPSTKSVRFSTSEDMSLMMETVSEVTRRFCFTVSSVEFCFLNISLTSFSALKLFITMKPLRRSLT